jgi:hypothetical protein
VWNAFGEMMFGVKFSVIEIESDRGKLCFREISHVFYDADGCDRGEEGEERVWERVEIEERGI